jgi:H+/Cl- antiporter ClcA
MRHVSFWLWALAGALIGLGSLFSPWLWNLVGRIENIYITSTANGWPLLVLGLLLAAALAWRTRGRGAWAGLLGLGLIPALLLAPSFFIQPDICPHPPGYTGPCNVHYFGPPWYDQVDFTPFVAFLFVAIIGALLGLVSYRARLRQARSASEVA